MCEIDAKWLRGGAPADEPFLDSADLLTMMPLEELLNMLFGISF